MNIQLIMLSEQPILVSDEKIKRDDRYYSFISNMIFDHDYDDDTTLSNTTKKVIAGLKGLPSIDFSGLSEDECKKIGWVDANKLAYNFFSKKEVSGWGGKNYSYDNEKKREGFITGFKTAQSLNDKSFSLEEVKTLLYWASSMGAGKIHSGKSYTDIAEEVETKIKLLSQPKVFDVEVLTYASTYTTVGRGEEPKLVTEHIPKIVNNSIKIIKVL